MDLETLNEDWIRTGEFDFPGVETWMDLVEVLGWESALRLVHELPAGAAVPERIRAQAPSEVKHMGPGLHPSGSPQQVHGGGVGQVVSGAKALRLLFSPNNIDMADLPHIPVDREVPDLPTVKFDATNLEIDVDLEVRRLIDDVSKFHDSRTKIYDSETRWTLENRGDLGTRIRGSVDSVRVAREGAGGGPPALSPALKLLGDDPETAEKAGTPAPSWDELRERAPFVTAMILNGKDPIEGDGIVIKQASAVRVGRRIAADPTLSDRELVNALQSYNNPYPSTSWERLHNILNRADEEGDEIQPDDWGFMPAARHEGFGPIIFRSPDPSMDEQDPLITTRTELREHMARMIASGHANQWAGTTNDENANALALQEAADRLFDMDDAMGWHETREDELVRDAVNLRSKVMRSFLRATHAETQELMAKHRIRGVAVHRGFSADVDPEHWGGGPIQLRPLSSFSLNSRVADDFASGSGSATVISGIAPAEQILAFPLTGLGATREEEVVLLGPYFQPDDVRGWGE